MDYPIKDDNFKVTILSKTERPNLLSYSAMRTDYGEKPLTENYEDIQNLSEDELGDRLVRNCIKFKHWGVLEHPAITFSVENFPHSVLVQARTHRIGLSIDAQSQRYTSKRLLELGEELSDYSYYTQKQLIEKVFYFRPIRKYVDREGDKYFYLKEHRDKDIEYVKENLLQYCENVKYLGYAPEHARDMLCQNIRQHFMITFNARSLLHFCDLRIPKDAQPEIRTMAMMIFDQFATWMPEVADWYTHNRLGKNKLAP